VYLDLPLEISEISSSTRRRLGAAEVALVRARKHTTIAFRAYKASVQSLVACLTEISSRDIRT
jgi:hypothetical protein